VIAQPYRRHRHQEFLRFLQLIDAAVPAGLDVHLICDNYGTHKTPAAAPRLADRQRAAVHLNHRGSWGARGAAIPEP
jgi:hypothetical protein